MRTTATLASLAVLLSAPAALSQATVGTAIIDGKKVELLDDKTWRFATTGDGTDADCRQLNPVVAFCGLGDWKATNVPSPDFLAAYQLNSRSFGGVIYEAIGSADGMSSEFMRDILLQYAAQASGVPVLDLVDVTVDQAPAEKMTYAIQLNGLDVVYQNTILIADTHTIQFLVWTIGSDYTDTQKSVAQDFTSHIRLDLDTQ